MTLSFISSEPDSELRGLTVFVSASIPDPTRWTGEANALEITDAVVALARATLTAGANLVTAAHPTIAPLLLYVAAELPRDVEARIATYQSDLFADVLPAATRRFEKEEIGRFVWTKAAANDRPVPGYWDASLERMRRQMLRETNPSAAAFIGGMEGITSEFALFKEICPGRPVYPLGRPGGEARRLVHEVDSPLHDDLANGAVYPALWRRVLGDLKARL
jgi:SLOG cluster3 family